MLIPSKKSIAVLGTVLLMVIAVALPALGADAKAKAPAGVWSAIGDSGEEDYIVIAIADGPAGDQAGFWLEAIVGPCDLGPGLVYGLAAKNGSTVTITGDFVCADTGDVLFEDFAWEATLQGGDLVPPEGYPETLLRACGDGNVTIPGTPGKDKLKGTSGNDIIDGAGGNDTLVGKDGIDILCGAGGKDKLKGGKGIDVMFGGDGNDKVIGGGGWDFGLGGAGKDTMKGGAGDDFMLGEAANDRIVGGGGLGDIANGGAGTDTCTAEEEIACEA